MSTKCAFTCIHSFIHSFIYARKLVERIILRKLNKIYDLIRFDVICAWNWSHQFVMRCTERVPHSSSPLLPLVPPCLSLWGGRLHAVVTHFRTVTRFISPSFGLKINMKIVFTCRQVEGISPSLFSFFLTFALFIYFYSRAVFLFVPCLIVSYRIVSCDWPRQHGPHSLSLRCYASKDSSTVRASIWLSLSLSFQMRMVLIIHLTVT